MVIDLIILITSTLGIQSSLPFLLVYCYIFTVVESVLKYIDSNSPFFDTFKSLIAQSFYYFKCFLFIICLMMTCTNLYIYLVTFDNNLYGFGLGMYIGTIMAMIGDSQWITQIDQFSEAFARYHVVVSVLATILVYFCQFILKHLVFSFFYGVVVSSKTSSFRIYHDKSYQGLRFQ